MGVDESDELVFGIDEVDAVCVVDGESLGSVEGGEFGVGSVVASALLACACDVPEALRA